MEWTVVVVVIALIGLLATVIGLAEKVTKPLNELTGVVTRLTGLVTACEKDLASIDRRNAESHERIYKRLDAGETRIQGLDLRVGILEHDNEKGDKS